MELSIKYGIPVIEDAAQAIDSFYKGKPLGSIGTFGTFSFHETKNIIAGEGGMLVINDSNYIKRAEIIREKGTNRSSFFRGEVDKYGWVDIGSSFLPSDIIAAYLYAQLEQIDVIQQKRIALVERYESNLTKLNTELFDLPQVPDYSTNNAHMFYLVFSSLDDRINFIEFMKYNNVSVVFHYLSLHSSPYYEKKHDGRKLVNSDFFSNCLVRLPLFYELSFEQVDEICGLIERYLEARESSS